MRTRTKVWLIIAGSLLVIGGILLAGVTTTLGWDFLKLPTEKYEKNIYTFSEAFDNISMNTDTADIMLAVSDDGKCWVECYEEENARHSVTVKDGTLTIELPEDEAVWHFGISFDSPKITVYLPKTEYASLFIDEDTGDIKIPKTFTFRDVEISLSTGDVNFYASASGKLQIKASTGDICVENISAGALDLSVSTGDVTASGITCPGDVTVGVSTGEARLADIRCKNVISRGSTGEISLDNVIATEKFSIERSTGSVKFNLCDAAEIFVKTNTGDITGSLLSSKVFIADSDAGSVDVPKTVNGGKCEVTTNTGSIKLDIQ